MTDHRIRVRVDVEVALDPNVVARWFAGLNSDQQAKFLIQVAKESEDWPQTGLFFGSWHQWWSVGKFLRDDKDAVGARKLVEDLYSGLVATSDQ